MSLLPNEQDDVRMYAATAQLHQRVSLARGEVRVRALDPTRDVAGVRLRTLRLRRGMSQVALAELTCISPTPVSIVETGGARCAAPATSSPWPTCSGSPRASRPTAGRMLSQQDRGPHGRPVPSPFRLPHAGPPRTSRPPVQPACPPRRPRHRGPAAPTGLRTHRQPMATARPDSHHACPPRPSRRK
jgi:helix-turn-helix protein